MRRLRGIAIDFTPLRVSPQYRRLWLGLVASSTGSQFTLVAVFVQLTSLTGSALAVGASGLAYLAGLIVGTVGFATVIDAWDRRRLLVLAQLGSMSGIVVLLVASTAGDPPIAVIYAGIAIVAAFSALDSPTRSAMTPRLIGADLMPSAQALNQVVWNTAALVGPAVAGFVIGATSLTVAYLIDLVSFLAMLFAAWTIAPMLPIETERRATGASAIREGFAFVRRDRLVRSTFVIDLVAMIFGSPRALFTFVIVEGFGRRPELVGLLFGAPAIGALLGALTSGWTKYVRAQGSAVLIAVAIWGAAIAAFGAAAPHLWIGLVALAAAGWADVISAIFRGTIMQLAVPDRLRGRLWQIHLLVVSGGPRLGDVEGGIVARATSPLASVVSGGLACIVGAWWVAVRYPELRRYRADARIGPNA